MSCASTHPFSLIFLDSSVLHHQFHLNLTPNQTPAQIPGPLMIPPTKNLPKPAHFLVFARPLLRRHRRRPGDGDSPPRLPALPAHNRQLSSRAAVPRPVYGSCARAQSPCRCAAPGSALCLRAKTTQDPPPCLPNAGGLRADRPKRAGHRPCLSGSHFGP